MKHFSIFLRVRMQQPFFALLAWAVLTTLVVLPQIAFAYHRQKKADFDDDVPSAKISGEQNVKSVNTEPVNDPAESSFAAPNQFGDWSLTGNRGTDSTRNQYTGSGPRGRQLTGQYLGRTDNEITGGCL
ncbi:MAG: hypothetical protein HY314_15135 [Acidobacteria bacterium]|nr:hypothetical protein [Acidobacteriota bacterium]